MKNIKTMRERRKKTQVQVAEELGITQQAYSAWETGARVPRHENLMSLAKALRCRVEQLL